MSRYYYYKCYFLPKRTISIVNNNFFTHLKEKSNESYNFILRDDNIYKKKISNYVFHLKKLNYTNCLCLLHKLFNDIILNGSARITCQSSSLIISSASQNKHSSRKKYNDPYRLKNLTFVLGGISLLIANCSDDFSQGIIININSADI